MAYPTWALVIGSILSSVLLVVINKQIFARGFPYVFTLSTLHFVVTCGLLQIMARVFGLFKVAYLPFATNLLVATFGVGSITLMNFSLKNNSIGFYQMLKLCIVPTCLVLNAYVYREYTTKKVIGSLALVLLGVGIATVTDVELNLVGSLFGVAAVLVTAQYQIWQGKKQKEAGLSSSQLALSVSFLQIFVGLAFALVFEARDLFFHKNEEGQGGALGLSTLILISCLLAVSVNVHSFALIGTTSAVTFQVVGHGKTCLILTSGYILHITSGKPISELYKNVFGVSVALFGVALYSNLKLNAGQADWCDRFVPSPILRYFKSEAGGQQIPATKDYAPVSTTERDEEEGDAV